MTSGPQQYNPDDYWDRLLKDRFDAAGVCWPNWPISYNKWLHRQQRRSFRHILKDFQTDLSRVVEIGPGVGFWTAELKQRGAGRYLGFDISAHSVEQLRRRFPGFEFHQTDFGLHDPRPEQRGVHTFALAVQVFLHITDNCRFERCLRNLSDMLAPGGLLVILDAVSKNPLKGNFARLEDGRRFSPSMSSRIRYLDKYLALARAAGLENLSVQPAFHFTQSLYDFQSDTARAFWSLYFRFLETGLCRCGETVGNALGMTLYGLDVLAEPFVGLGCSSKWLVFRKV